MKMIDEKGRLLGKINIIDFLVVIFFLSLIPMFYFGYKSFKSDLNTDIRKKEEPKKEFVDIAIDCLFVKLQPEVAKLISVGDKESDVYGIPLGEIVEVGNVSPYIYEFNIGASQKITKEDVILKQIPVKLRIKAETRGNDLYYQDKQIGNGLTAKFTTSKYTADFSPSFNNEIKIVPTDTKVIDLWLRLGNIENTLSGLNEKLEYLGKKIDKLSTEKPKKR